MGEMAKKLNQDFQKHEKVNIFKQKHPVHQSSPKFCRLVINIETVCSDAVEKQDGNFCYKE